MGDEQRSTWLDSLVGAALALVFLKNYWVSEDAYLNFRSVDQLLLGHGPIWNPHERVQVFTSPLWYWLHALVQLVLRDGYLAVFVLSCLAFGLTVWWMRQVVGSSFGFALAALALIGSNAAFDYTSSGQENVLAYCLVLYFLRAYFALAASPDRPNLVRLCAAAGLALVCRHDLVTFIAPCLGYMAFRQRSARDERDWPTLAGLTLAPMLVWSLFSLIYYGSVFPNTAYAKLSAAFPRAVFLERGLDYVAVMARYDSLSVLAIAAAIVALMLQRTAASRWLAVSIASQVAYVVWVGGDYMQGRFLSLATLVSIVVLARLPFARAWPRPALALGLAVYALAYPHTPLKTSLLQPKEDSAVHAPGREFVMDARGTLGVYTSLYSYVTASDRDAYPEHPLAIEGRKFARSERKVAVIHAAGMFGWAAGPSKIIIEAHGIADPLLARLPASVFAGVGHYMRYRPGGYVDGLAQGRVRLEDADLDTYYRKLALITQGPSLFSLERLKTIALFNLGAYDSLLEHFVSDKIRGKQVLPKAR